MHTGAILPSSKSLTKEMVSYIDFLYATCIVEVGTGMGTFTQAIISKIWKDALYIGIESNKKFVEETKRRCDIPTVYHGSAADIDLYLAKHDKKKCEYIVSWIPRASFNEDLQENLLGKLYSSLEEWWKLITFAYVHGLILPSGIYFQKLLKKKFLTVTKSKVIRDNIPPAIVYCCTK